MEGKLVSKASQPFPAHTKVVYIMGPRTLVINLLSTKASASRSHCTYTHFLPQDSALSDPYHTSLAREYYPLTIGFGARLRLPCSGSVFFTLQTTFLLQKKSRPAIMSLSPTTTANPIKHHVSIPHKKSIQKPDPYLYEYVRGPSPTC